MHCEFCRAAMDEGGLICPRCRKLTQVGRSKLSKRVIIALWLIGAPLAIIVVLAVADSHDARRTPPSQTAEMQDAGAGG